MVDCVGNFPDIGGRAEGRRSARRCSAALRCILGLLILFAVIAAQAGAEATGAEDRTLHSASDYAVRHEQRTIGTVRATITGKGVFVWPENLLPLLGIAVERNSQTGTLTLQLAEGTMMALDARANSYTKDGAVHNLELGDVIVTDGHIQANVEFLNHLLPRPIFLTNQADRSLSIVDGECSGPGTWCRIPPELTTKRQLVTVDGAGEAQNTAVKYPSEPAQPPVANASGREEAETLIVQPKIKNLPSHGEFLEIIDRGGTVFLPLNDVVQLFGFPVKVDRSRNTASGYMFEPANAFLLDATAKSMRVGDRRFALTSDSVMMKDGAIYISADAFAEWFDIKTMLDRKQQTILFTTDRLLPQEDIENRKLRWQALLDHTNAKTDDLPLLPNPYRLIDYPVFDINLNGVHTYQPGVSAHSSDTSANYIVQGVGDVAYATGHIYMAGATNGRLLDTLRLTLGRKDPDRELLGGMHATEFALGDITSPSQTLVTSASIGRGLMLTNRAVDLAENFDVRSFSGDAVPGYQAELYRNGELIGFKIVGADGRYNFENIPILYGENGFRIVLYGPQGQKEERLETIEASASLLKQNQLEYTFGITERGASLIPVTKSRQSAWLPMGIQSVASLRYGLLPYLTASTFAAATPLKDGEHYYFGGGMVGSLSSMQAETTFVRDLSSGGWAAGISGMGSLYGLNLRAYFRQYNQFASEAVNANDTPLSQEMGIDSNGQALLPLVGTFSYGLSASHRIRENSALAAENVYSFRLAKAIGRFAFSNTANFSDYSGRTLQDTFALTTRVGRIDFRLSGIYDFVPVGRLDELNLTMNYQVYDGLSGQSEVEKTSSASGTYNFTQALYFDFEAFRFGLYGRMDTAGAYSTGISLTLSLSHNPVTGSWHSQPAPGADSGVVAGRVFVKPDGDTPQAGANLQNAVVRVDNRTASVDPKNGYLANWATPYRRIKVEIDPNSVTDPLLSPQSKGYQVITRPGSAVVTDFPMVMTTVIEGAVYILDKNGVKQPLGNAVVELQDKDGMALRRIVTEFDGYFTFDHVVAGTYRLSVPPEVLKEYKAVIKAEPQISIAKVTEFINNRDIVLTPAD